MQPKTMQPEPSVVKNRSLPQIAAIFCASLAGFSNGLSYSWTSPAIPMLVKDPTNDINNDNASYFTVISAAAMLISAPFVSRVSDLVGRKNGILLLLVPQSLTWILIVSSQNLWVLYASRVFNGIGEVGLYATIPVYICEISEPQVRGTWGNLLALMIYFGMFCMNLIGSYLNITYSSIFCLSIIAVNFLLFIFMPESPYYQLIKNNEKEALTSLQWLRGNKDVYDEMFELQEDVRRQVSDSKRFSELFTNRANRSALFMCAGIYFAQQLTGLSAFEVHTQYMFDKAGTSISEKVSAIIFSGVYFASTGLASFFVESLGRRFLMFVSCTGCAIALTVTTAYFCLEDFTELNVSKSFGWIPLVGMIVYIIFCASGISLLPFLILGEVFPANYKAMATSIMNTITSICLLVIPKFFQVTTENFGIFSPFCFFAVWCYLGIVFARFYMLETKGKTLEEIQQEFKRRTAQPHFV